MEILTLLKANIRRKKGSFISVILLTLIIAMSITVVLSTRESALRGVDYAHEINGSYDLQCFYYAYRYSDEYFQRARDSSLVKEAEVLDIILASSAKIGGKEHPNTSMLYEYSDAVKILREDLGGIKEETAPPLEKGEIYVSQGLLTNVNGRVGDTVVIETLAGNYEFTVKGILLDPMTGSAMIGWKSYCINGEDFDEIYSAVAAAETEDVHGLGKVLGIKKADDCGLSDAKFRRRLNLDIGVIDTAYGSITRDMSVNYTTLFVTVGCSVLTVFAVLLLVIVVIVTVHSISVEIETEYVTFGVLKSQGFDKSKICLLFLGQYMLAEIIGAVLGIALSIPLVTVSSNVFVTITAAPALLSVPLPEIAAVIGSLFVLSAVSVLLITKKINKISPMRAISGAKKEIYFDSRIKAPISRGLLSPSLALRQFTSAKRRYIGALAIVVVLVFFMTTITALANTVTSRSALESMGMIISDIAVSPNRELTDEDFAQIEEEIERFSHITKTSYVWQAYFSFEGDEIMGDVEKDPSVLPALEGRTPIYDNEIAVSPILLEEFDLKIGDEVTVGLQNQKDKYLIVGTVQYMNDVGRCFLIPYEGAKRIGGDSWLWGDYTLEEKTDAAVKEDIVEALNEKFGDIVGVRKGDNIIDESIETGIKALQLIIYVFSVLFSLIVIQMVCSKAFAQERTDIGIYKAVGFTSADLRLQFSVRFFIVAAIGSVIGTVLSVLFSDKLLGLLLKSVGLTSFNRGVVFSSFALPIVIVCLSFLLFSYLASGKTRSVRIRELVAE